VHFALGQCAGHFQETVRQRGFAVVNVRDDAEIPYELRIHFSLLPVFSVPDFLCYRQEFESPADIFPVDVLAAFERQTQGKNRAEQSFSLPQIAVSRSRGPQPVRSNARLP
jgi:hypothetical protein